MTLEQPPGFDRAKFVAETYAALDLLVGQLIENNERQFTIIRRAREATQRKWNE